MQFEIQWRISVCEGIKEFACKTDVHMLYESRQAKAWFKDGREKNR